MAASVDELSVILISSPTSVEHAKAASRLSQWHLQLVRSLALLMTLRSLSLSNSVSSTHRLRQFVLPHIQFLVNNADLDFKGWLHLLDAEVFSNNFELKEYITVTKLAALTETDLDQLRFSNTTQRFSSVLLKGYKPNRGRCPLCKIYC